VWHPPKTPFKYYIPHRRVSPARFGIISSVFILFESINADIYTAATVLLGARLCLKKEELGDIDEDWNLTLDYLKRISLKSISAERCLKALEVMHSQLSRLSILNLLM
jgi:hypothetical protein